MLDNTLIVFLSDNGGNAEGGPPGVTRGEGPIGGPQSYVLLGMNWATLANTPFRRYKHFTHEGGISSPLIAHWPRGIPAGRRTVGAFPTFTLPQPPRVAKATANKSRLSAGPLPCYIHRKSTLWPCR